MDIAQDLMMICSKDWLTTKIFLLPNMALCSLRTLSIHGRRPNAPWIRAPRTVKLAGGCKAPRLRRVPPTKCAAEPTTEGSAVEQNSIPPGCSRYSVELPKPLGIVLETDATNMIYVAEIAEGSNAAEQGDISVGDQLISTSGVVYTTGQTYGETFVKGGEEVVQMNVQGETFDAVLAAIGSHPGHVPVKLMFQRCE